VTRTSLDASACMYGVRSKQSKPGSGAVFDRINPREYLFHTYTVHGSGRSSLISERVHLHNGREY